MQSVDIKTKFLGIPLHNKTLDVIGEQALDLKNLIVPSTSGDILFHNPVATLTETGLQLQGAGVVVEKDTLKPISSQRVVTHILPERVLNSNNVHTFRRLGITREVVSTNHEKAMKRQVRRLSSFY